MVWLKMFIMVALAGAWVACSDPCRSLSEQICNCYPTLAQQQSCTQRVDALAGQHQADPDSDVEKAKLERCEDLMASCTCEALAEGNLAACGLSNE